MFLTWRSLVWVTFVIVLAACTLPPTTPTPAQTADKFTPPRKETVADSSPTRDARGAAVPRATETLLPASVPLPTGTPFSATPRPAPTADRFTSIRRQMVADQIRARDVRDAEVLRAMESVPRHEFVPSEWIAQAYADHPLPIGQGQTISQPYIVAAMTELAQIKRGDRVLEIGTGSGYQAAILAELTDQVYSVEIIPSLAEGAAARLKQLGYTNVVVKNADGYNGWQEYAPFDAILVTAAPDHIPPPLVAQLKDGGRMVIPVGPVGGFQTLWRVNKRGDQVTSENIMGVIFVPLTRGK